jgi:hypothetical protein
MEAILICIGLLIYLALFQFQRSYEEAIRDANSEATRD